MASNVGEIVKWGLIAVGGYLAWNWYENTFAATAVPATPTTPAVPTTPVTPSTPTTPTTPTTPVVTNPPSTPLANLPLSTLAQKVLNAAGGSGKTLTADQWNYYWSNVSGVHQTADLFPAGNRTALLTFTQYLANRQAKNLGVSGLRGLRGHGRNYIPARTPMRRVM